MREGNSGKLTALKPRAALASTSAAAISTSFSQVSCSGIMRSGVRAAQTSMCQSLNARMQASPRSLSWARGRRRRRSPRRARGSKARPRCRPGPCHRCARDVEAARAHLWSKRAGSMLHSFRAANHRVQADVRVEVALEDPCLGATLQLDDLRRAVAERAAGRRPSNMSRGSIRWSSTEITGTRTGRGSGSGNNVTRCSAVVAAPSPRLVPRKGDTIVRELVRHGGAHDHTRRGRHYARRPGHRRAGRGGRCGSYPVTNPARPSEVVLDAPSTSPEQLDRAVAAARRAQPAWAARAMEDRAPRSSPRRRRGARSWRPRPGAPPHPGARQDASSRRSSTPRRWPGWRQPSRRWWPTLLAGRTVSGGATAWSSGCPTAWWP